MCAGVSLDDVLKCVQILFYIATVAIAWYGVHSWKDELQGRAEYEVATNVLAGAYRLRDAIKRVQAPLMTYHEWVGREKKETETERQTAIYNSYYAFNNRFDVVRDAVNDWYPHVIRAEAVFGIEAKSACEALAKVKNSLWVAIDMWHQNELKRREHAEGFTSLYNVMYGVDPAENPNIPEEARRDNGFHAEFKAAMSGIEKFFRPKIDRRKGKR